MMKIKLGKKHFAIIDNEDYERISAHHWYYSQGYGRNTKTNELMHRFILNSPNGDIDHINRNKTDNRKENLRICTKAENVRNSSPKGGTSVYKGVSYGVNPRLKNKWIAQITYNYKTEHIGTFQDEISAAKAYNQKAKEYFGEYAYLNPI